MRVICTWGGCEVTKRCRAEGLLAVVELALSRSGVAAIFGMATLSLASINSPTSCVIAGDPATIEAQSVLQGTADFL